jgi:predicted membrane-bound spermidine synthase
MVPGWPIVASTAIVVLLAWALSSRNGGGPTTSSFFWSTADDEPIVDPAGRQWFGIHPKETILYRDKSAYQDIVVVEYMNDVILFIDGVSQFSSREEYRYHESLVHPAMAARLAAGTGTPLRVLLLGAGDGLAAREVLSYGGRVAKVDLVDLDPHITSLFKEDSARAIPRLVEMTKRSLTDPCLTLYHMCARQFVVDAAVAGTSWDVVILDLPDPVSEPLSDLYSSEFYREVLAVSAKGGLLVTQATGLLGRSGAFWTIEATLRHAVAQEAAFRQITQEADAWARPYAAYIPSWGEWGFVVASVDSPAPHLNKWPLVPTDQSTKLSSSPEQVRRRMSECMRLHNRYTFQR